MNRTLDKADVWLRLTVPTAVLLAIAAASGVLVPSLYRDTASLAAQAMAQDTITIAVALPALAIGAFLTARGSQRARMVWLGALVYTVYTYVGYAFDIRFNHLFLVYVALLGCSTYALIGGLASTDRAGIKAAFTERTPVRAVSMYLGAIAALFYLLWLSEAVPASIAGVTPKSVTEAGTPTNLVHVLDMAWLLPAMAIAAVSLWRKHALGYVLSAALLIHLALLLLAILLMVFYMTPERQPVPMAQVSLFGVLSAASIALAVWSLRNLKSSRPEAHDRSR